MTVPPDLRTLTEVEKDALIRALWAQVQSLTARVAELQARLNQPPKTPGNSSLPPSRPGFAVCGQRLELTVRFQDVTKGPVKACAYRRSGLGRER